jgi:hypothetical protein
MFDKRVLLTKLIYNNRQTTVTKACLPMILFKSPEGDVTAAMHVSTLGRTSTGKRRRSTVGPISPLTLGLDTFALSSLGLTYVKYLSNVSPSLTMTDGMNKALYTFPFRIDGQGP